jgi:lysozyme family protein
MSNIFQDIAQAIVEEINDAFIKKQPSVTAVSAGHVTVPVLQPPSFDSPITHKDIPLPITIQPGTWSVASMTAEILKSEGGLVDDPNDSGGITNYGISFRFASDHPEYFDINHDGAVTADDIRNITVQQAANAYIKYFYMPAHFNLVPNVANIVMQLYDMAVNMGVRLRDGETNAVKIMQRAIGAVDDGVLGPSTLAALNVALNAQGANAVNDAIVGKRIAFYKSLAANNPQDKKFLVGWVNRATKYSL